MASTKTTDNSVVIATSQGDAEAVREGAGSVWEIGYPWGDDRFYGSRAEVTSRMRNRIAEEEAAEAA